MPNDIYTVCYCYIDCGRVSPNEIKRLNYWPVVLSDNLKSLSWKRSETAMLWSVYIFNTYRMQWN